MSEYEVMTYVVKLGSVLVRAGVIGENAPTIQFPSIVGKSKTENASGITDFVGEDAYNRRENLKIESPFLKGISKNWDNCKAILNHLFIEKLAVIDNQKEFNVIVTVRPGLSMAEKNQLSSYLLEIGAKGVLFVDIEKLANKVTKQSSGVYMSVGYGGSCVCTFAHDTLIPLSDKQMSIGTRDVQNECQNLLMKNGHRFNSWSEYDEIRRMIEDIGYISMNSSNETPEKTTYKIGRKDLDISDENFKCFEVLYDMSILGKDSVGIQNLVHNSIDQSSDFDKKEVFKNIFVTGTITKVRGFVQRLETVLHTMNPLIPEIKVETLEIGFIMMEGAKKIIENGGIVWITKPN